MEVVRRDLAARFMPSAVYFKDVEQILKEYGKLTEINGLLTARTVGHFVFI